MNGDKSSKNEDKVRYDERNSVKLCLSGKTVKKKESHVEHLNGRHEFTVYEWNQRPFKRN